MANSLKDFETLVKTRELEVEDGVFIHCGEEIKLSIFHNKENDSVIIKFDAPFAYLRVKKLGPKRLVNLLDPKIELVEIKEKSIRIELSNFPDFEIERDTDE